MDTSTQELIATLRERGYAVVVFSSTELRGADPTDVENRLIELGNEVIETVATRPYDEDDAS